MREGNNLRTIRVTEGLTISVLARHAQLSSKVISQTERLLRNPTSVTKSKIVKGLNAALGSEGSERTYTFKDVFPQDRQIELIVGSGGADS